MINYILIGIMLIVIYFIIYYTFSYNRNDIDIKNCPKYLINLDRRYDRLKTTSFLLKKCGYKNIMRYSAIDGSKITPHKLKKLVHKDSLEPIYKKQRTQHDELSIGAVGCYLSHVNVWKLIENNKNYNYAIIFEDDTNPTINQDELQDILSDIPSDWDVILLGANYNIKNDFNHNKFYKVNRFFCLHAYIINKRAINKISSNLYPIQVQIDWVLSNMSNDGLLNIYTIKNSKWYQNHHVNSTDIQTPVIQI